MVSTEQMWEAYHVPLRQFIRARVQRARNQLRKLLSCCRFAFDRRGHIIDYSPLGQRCAGGACGAEES